MFRFVKAAEDYRKFIRNFSTITGPLYRHAPLPGRSSSSSKHDTFQLTVDKQSSFDQLKLILTGDLVLRLPNHDLPFKLQTDASQIGIGAILLQQYPEGYRPVCFMSKKFTTSQQRWPVIEQECYAIVSASKHWHHYLQGQRFILETDHRPLETLTQKRQLNAKCERWRLFLQSYDFDMKHIAGTSNYMPDYLSRSPVDIASDDPDDDIAICTLVDQQTSIPLVTAAVTTRSRAKAVQRLSDPLPSSNSTSTPISKPSLPSLTSSNRLDDLQITFDGDLDILRSAQAADPHLQSIIDHVTDDRFADHYMLDNGLLMHFENSSKPVPCVPEGPIRRDIMRIYHDTPGNGGHFGRDKTLRKIRDRYYWDSMEPDITDYVRSCIKCSENSPVRRKPAGYLTPIAPPEGVWQLLFMDFHGPITPTSRRGNRYIISLTDVLSKFVITRAVRDCTASTAARFLQEDVICKYGTHFNSSMMEHLLQRLGIVHLYSTPYHPQTNGQIERYNATMDAKIASLSNPSRSN